MRRTRSRKAHLPFTTFVSIAELGLEVHVYCSKCYAMRRIDPLADAVRDRQFVGARRGFEPTASAESVPHVNLASVSERSGNPDALSTALGG